MTLSSGTYVPKNDVRVIHWKKPDADGTGEPMQQDKYDDQGRVIGRDFVRDAMGKVVKPYPQPQGFENLRSHDGSDNYVLRAKNGEVQRTPTGEAVNIKPGQTLLMYPDGSTSYLEGDYDRYVFEGTHDRTSDTVSVQNDGAAVESDEDTISAEEYAQFKAWQTSQAAA